MHKLEILKFLTFLLVTASATTRPTKSSSSNMSSEAFAHLHLISQDLSEPTLGSRVMHTTLCNNLKLTKRVLTKNLLNKMMLLRIGTNEVDY